MPPSLPPLTRGLLSCQVGGVGSVRAHLTGFTCARNLTLTFHPEHCPPPLGGAASLAGGRRAFVCAPPPPPEGGVMEGGGGGVSVVWCGVFWHGGCSMVWYGMVWHDGGVLWYGMV